MEQHQQQPQHRREAGGVTSGRFRIRGRTTMSPPRASSPSSIMTSLSTVHGTFIHNTSANSNSPEGSPRSTASSNASSNSSLGGGRSYPGVGISGSGRPPPRVVSPTSPNNYNNSDNYHSPPYNEHSSNSSSNNNNSTNTRPRMTVSELETVSSAASLTSVSALPPSQQPHHPSYSLRRVRSSPAASSSAQQAASQRGGAVYNNSPVFHNSSFFSEANEEAVGSGISSSFSMDRPHNTTSSSSSSSSSGVMKLVHAVQQNEPRPSGLTLEEKALWDAIQVCKRQARKEALDAVTEQQQQQQQPPPTSWSTDPDSTWETRLLQIQEQAKLQQRDNSRSLQAIQRVLADVQAQRDDAVLQLQDYLTVPAGGGADSSCTTCSSCDPERESMQRDLQAMSKRIVLLEKGLRRTPSPSNTCGPLVPVVDTANNTSATNSPATQNTTDLEEEYEQDNMEDEDDHEPSTGVDDPVLPSLELDRLEQENKALHQELEWRENEMRNLKTELAESQDVRCLEATRQELQDKSSALENAKMIIGSLENASGSLASDLRAKMKLRDEEIARLQTEAAQLKRTADRLATELRTAQKKAQQEQQPSAVNKKRAAEAEQVKRLQLSSRLETNMAEICAASVVLESTQDPGAMANLSVLLTDSIGALKEGIDVIENGCSGDERLPARLWKELEEKRKTVKRLEEKLETRDEELARIRERAEAADRQREVEVQNLHAEIKILRQQCDTNMEVLTRKERELTVLRDSLMEGDDAAVGYISDDDDDEEEDPSDNDNHNSSKHLLSGTVPPVPTEYGPTQAEALATLLAAGGNRSFDSAIVTNEEHLTRNLQTVMAELTKTRTDYDKSKRELKVQKESLSNAKMIISSLERANKSMMEDLRARLQDSNTAIASLLEKSLESERTCATLRAELESMKRAASRRRHEEEEEETALALPPTPLPLLLTETID